jgi:hypothetical protein
MSTKRRAILRYRRLAGLSSEPHCVRSGRTASRLVARTFVDLPPFGIGFDFDQSERRAGRQCYNLAFTRRFLSLPEGIDRVVRRLDKPVLPKLSRRVWGRAELSK